MELLYLWVEDYKNIKRQGFNFSPRYRFDFDYENKELSYEEFTERDRSGFFGENISNITAIVGKNGSGKSSLINLIRRLNGMKWDVNNSKQYEKIFFVYRRDQGKKIGMINLLNLKRIIVRNIKLDEEYNVKDGKDLEIDFYHEEEVITYNYQNSRIDMFESYQEINISNLDYFIDKIRIDNSERRNSENSWRQIRKENELLYDLEFEDFRRQIELIKKLKEKKIYNNKLFEKYSQIDEINIIPKKFAWEYKLDYEIIDFIETNKEKKCTNILKKILTKVDKKYLNRDYVIMEKTGKPLSEKCKDMKEKEMEDFFKKLSYELEIKELSKSELSNLEREVYDFSYKKYLITKNTEGEFEKNWKNIKYFVYLEKIKKEEDNKKPKEYLKMIDEEYIKDTLKIIELMESNEFKLNYKQYEENIEKIEDYSGQIYTIFPELSTGEKEYLNFFSRIYSVISKDVKIIKEKNKIKIILDEADVFLHPEWKRDYLKNLKDYLKFISEILENDEIKFDIILTTHSPFILSDLPKENVIFLDKDGEGNCRVVSSDSMKQTFGANIHTLFSNSFFMDSTIGAFAKSKIDWVLKILDKDLSEIRKNEKKIRGIIDIIGEPILKKALLNRLKDKIKLDYLKTDIKFEQNTKIVKCMQGQLNKQDKMIKKLQSELFKLKLGDK